MSEKNYQEYVYENGAVIEMSKEVFEDLFGILNEVVKDNSREEFTEHYLFINKETDKEVKSPKEADLESGKVIKVPNVDKLLSSTPTITYNAKAMNAISMILRLNKVHAENVDNGKAKHISELKK